MIFFHSLKHLEIAPALFDSFHWFWQHNHALVELRAAKFLASLQLVRVLLGLVTSLRVPPAFV